MSDHKVLGAGECSHGDHKNDDEEVYGLAPSPVWQQLGTAGTSNVTGPEDWQAEFNTIKQTLTKVKLTKDIWDQVLANIITKCGRFAKTTLKLLWKTQSGTDVTEKLLIEVYTC